MESILPLLAQTQKASIQICNKTTSEKKALLASLATKLQENVEQIMAANRLDLDKMDDSNPKKDRLLLNENRIKDLAESLISITQLADPSGKILSEYKAENGLLIQKIAVPVGVVGVIYEARPNVTIDVAALCMYAGNAVVLRGGSDAEHTNSKLVQVIHDTLDEHKWDKNGVQLLPVERKFVSQLLTAVRYVDIIIPRGSQQLIDFVRDNAKVPTIETGAGVCHTYVEQSANLDMAAQIVVNAKTQRPSVCNALDTVLVDVAIAEQFLPKLLPGFLPFEVEIFADYEAYDILKEANYPYLKKATDDNFGME
ncbi:MAG TPA: glutamate-5-semialdehyde dehydrogenase, partial [Chitinophagales bacterium]|nr:glutamate-5-semialdehyde dehydrogenase [Chitinophagales bacterium]